MPSWSSVAAGRRAGAAGGGSGGGTAGAWGKTTPTTNTNPLADGDAPPPPSNGGATAERKDEGKCDGDGINNPARLSPETRAQPPQPRRGRAWGDANGSAVRGGNGGGGPRGGGNEGGGSAISTGGGGAGHGRRGPMGSGADSSTATTGTGAPRTPTPPRGRARPPSSFADALLNKSPGSRRPSEPSPPPAGSDATPNARAPQQQQRQQKAPNAPHRPKTIKSGSATTAAAGPPSASASDSASASAVAGDGKGRGSVVDDATTSGGGATANDAAVPSPGRRGWANGGTGTRRPVWGAKPPPAADGVAPSTAAVAPGAPAATTPAARAGGDGVSRLARRDGGGVGRGMQSSDGGGVETRGGVGDGEVDDGRGGGGVAPPRRDPEASSKVDGSAAEPTRGAPPQSMPEPQRGETDVSSSSLGGGVGVKGGGNGRHRRRRSSPQPPGGRGGGRGTAAAARDRGGGRGAGAGAGVAGKNRSKSKNGGGRPLPPVCHFYRQNRCRAGSGCRFRHSDGDDGASETAAAAATIGGGINAGRRKGRPFCPIRGSAVGLALALQDAERMPWREFDDEFFDDEDDDGGRGPFYGVDVECVATGHGHRHRAPARVAVVDGGGDVVLDEFVRFPDDDDSNDDGNGEGRGNHGVVSYLTPLTGLTREMCQRPENLTIDGVIEKVRDVLPSDAILVGHGIQHDADWLRLREGVDYRAAVDTVFMFRRRVPPPSSLPSFASRALAAAHSSSDMGDDGGVDGVGSDGPRAIAVREAAAGVLAAIRDAKIAREEAKAEAEAEAAAVAVEAAEDDNGESISGGREADEEGGGGATGELLPPANPRGGGGEPPSSPSDAAPPTVTPSPPPPTIPPPQGRYRIFSLRHVCLHLLGVDVQDGSHDPTVDASYSLKLFFKYRKSSPEMLRAARDALHRAPPTLGFAALHPVVDGVCLSRESYRYKHAARFIWRWWIGVRWKRGR